jgi:hypothetical protein
MAKTLRERLASMSHDQIMEAWRATARGDERRRAEGLLEIVDDRAEVSRIIEERLPALSAAVDEVLDEQASGTG